MNRMHKSIKDIDLNQIYNRIQNLENQLQNLIPKELNYLDKVLELKTFLEDNGIKFHMKSYDFSIREYEFHVNDGEIMIQIDADKGNYVISNTYEEDIIIVDKRLVKVFIDNN